MYKKIILIITLLFSVFSLYSSEEISILIEKEDSKNIRIKIILSGEDFVDETVTFGNGFLFEDIEDDFISLTNQGDKLQISIDDQLENYIYLAVNSLGELQISRLRTKKDVKIKTFGNIKINASEFITKRLSLNGANITNSSNSSSMLCRSLIADSKIFSCSGEIVTSKYLNINANRLYHDGKITSQGDLFLNAAFVFTDLGSIISSQGKLKFKTIFLEHFGLINSGGDQHLGVNDLINIGNIESNGEIYCKSRSIINAGNMVTAKAEMDCKEFINNENLIVFDGDLKINSSNKIENDNGRIDAKKNIVLTSKSFKNISGYIFANGDIIISAEDFFSRRGNIEQRMGESTPEEEKDLHWQGPYETETADASFIVSRKGNVNLNLKNGTNEASLIYSHLNTNITAETFDNKSHNLKNITKWWKKGRRWRRKLGFKGHGYDTWDVEEIVNYHYNAASIVSCGKMFITIKGKKFTVEGKRLPYSRYFKNTGHIQSRLDLEIKADGEYAEFLNGLTNESRKTALIMPTKVDFPLIPKPLKYRHLEKDSIKMLADSKNVPYYTSGGHSKWFIDHAFNRGFAFNINPSLFAYTNINQFTSDMMWLASPAVQAEALQEELFRIYGLPLLPGFFDSIEQFQALIENGYIYSLVNGDLQPFPNALPSGDEPCDGIEIDKDHLETFRNCFCKKDCISLEELIERYCQTQKGSHGIILSQEQIEDSPEHLAVLSEVEVNGKTFLMTNVHLGESLFAAVHPEASVISHEGKVKQTAPYIKNTGYIKGKQVHIIAHTFENEKKVTKHTETVRESGGWFHSDRIRYYEIRTPQIGGEMYGGIEGILIEVKPADEHKKGKLKNRGGTIKAKHNIHVITRNADIVATSQVATHVVRWNPGDFGKIMGKRSSSLAKSFLPGQVISEEGQVELISETERVIIEASKIFAEKDINIHGYLGVILKGLQATWTKSSKMNFSGLGVTSERTEGHAYENTQIVSAAGDVNITSEETVELLGPQVHAGRDVIMRAKNIKISPNILKDSSSYSKTGFYDLSFSHSETRTLREFVLPTEITAGRKIDIKSELDNVIEAVIVSSGEVIHIVAGQDNVFKGAKETFSSETTGFSLGVSFFGSETIKSVMNNDLKGAVWNLADEDPLIRALHSLKDSKDGADIGGSSVYVGMEAAKLLLATKEVLKSTHGTFKGLIGERLGITRMDENGKSKFDPKITLRLGIFESSQKETSAVRTHMETGELYVESGRDTKWSDGTTAVASENATLKVGRNLEIDAAEDTFEQESSSVGVSASIAAKSKDFLGASVDFAESQAEGKTYYNAMIVTPEAEIDVDGDVIAEGFELLTDEATINIGGDFYFKSKQNTFDNSSSSGSFGVGVGTGFSVSGSYGEQRAHSAKTQMSQISGKKVYITAEGKIKAVGVLFDGGEGSFIRAKAFEYEDLEDYDFSDGFHFSLSTPSFGKDLPPSQAGNWGSGDFDVHNKYEYGETRTTVSEEIEIDVENDLEGLCRSEECMQVTTSKGGSHFRLVLPMNIPGFIEDLNSLKDLFRKETLTPEDYRNAEDGVNGIKEKINNSEKTSEDEVENGVEVEREKRTFYDEDGSKIEYSSISIKKNEKDNDENGIRKISDPQNERASTIVLSDEDEYTIISLKTDSEKGIVEKMSHFLADIMVDTVIEANRQLAKSGFVDHFDFSEEAKQVVYENFRKPVDNMILGGGDVVIDVPIFLLGLLEGFAIFNREVVDGLHDDVVLPEKLSKYLESNSLKPPITSFVEDYVKDKWSSLFPTNKDDSEAMLWRSKATTTLDCAILGFAATSIFKKGMKLLGKIKRPSSAVGSSLASEAAIAEEATLAKKVNNAAKSTLAEAKTTTKPATAKKLSKSRVSLRNAEEILAKNLPGGKTNPNYDKLRSILKEAATKDAYFTIEGTVTTTEADALGKAFLGEGYTIEKGGYEWYSLDRSKRYRRPALKQRGVAAGKTQANFESNPVKSKKFENNAHVNVEE